MPKNFSVQSWIDARDFAAIVRHLRNSGYNVKSKADVIRILVKQAVKLCKPFEITEQALTYLEACGLGDKQEASAPTLIDTLGSQAELAQIIRETEQDLKQKKEDD